MESFVLLRIVGLCPLFTWFDRFASFRLVSNAVTCACDDFIVHCLSWETYLLPVVHSDWRSCGSGILDSSKSLGTLGIMNCFAWFSPLRVESNAGSCACVVVFRCWFWEEYLPAIVRSAGVSGGSAGIAGLLTSMLALGIVNSLLYYPPLESKWTLDLVVTLPRWCCAASSKSILSPVPIYHQKLLVVTPLWGWLHHDRSQMH